ncbi:3-oxo-tetronate kinase [Lichenicoccus sp.]|uniref:3-oxo-tetronate kinase n=1 Tax=Lichenicoccus sp. TaxID=2781899 RepID=UPI003D0D32C1
MRIVLGCIADDYTGASDLASMLSLAGLRTLQTIGVPHDVARLPETDAVVVSLKSRSIAPAEAVRQSLEAETWLRAQGAGHVLFKICSTFDSTDAGNIGPVLDALRDKAGAGTVLVNPSFPENGRSVYQGHLFVGSMLLQESPLKDHPLNPMRDSDLVRVLSRQSAHSVILVPLAVVEQGPDAVRAALARSGGAGAAIVDSVAARHLDAIAEVALDGPLSTGASGLGASLARALMARGLAQSGGAAAPQGEAGGKAAILAGSCSAATLRQIARAEQEIACLHLDAGRLLAEPEAARDHAVQWGRARLDGGPVLIASSDTPASVRALQEQHGGAAVGHAVEHAFAEIAASLVAAGVRRLIVAGGETSGAVVDRLRLEAFLIGTSIAPGVPVLHSVGGPHNGLRLALKSGNFGGDDFFERALQLT